MQLKAIATQIYFETKEETLKEQEQERKDRETKSFWERITLYICLAYAVSK